MIVKNILQVGRKLSRKYLFLFSHLAGQFYTMLVISKAFRLIITIILQYVIHKHDTLYIHRYLYCS